jgi:cytochrome P450
MTLTVTEAGRALTDPSAYADEARLHEALELLRRKEPVHWVEADGFAPFWAITRHADIMEIERNHTLFLNAPRPLLATAEMDAVARQREAEGIGLRTLIHMDDPQHRVVRAIGADWFRPGLPESDFPRLLRLTQELFGGDDEEFQRGSTPEELIATLLDFFGYFQGITNARRETPTDDLASAIANARVDGEYLSDIDVASYYVIIATAGHDTTSSTISGGLHALVQHPGELARLQDDATLLPAAVDEMIRWVTPVKEFMRTATADTQVGGVTIKEGEAVLLSYPSGNRDQEVFTDPFRFDVGRDPNKHLAFGFGVHYCLGAALARMETRALFAELLPRLESIKFAGQPEWTATTFVGGLKHLPVRYSLKV